MRLLMARCCATFFVQYIEKRKSLFGERLD